MRYSFNYPVFPLVINQIWGVPHPEYPPNFGFHLHNGVDFGLVPGQDVCSPNVATVIRVGSQPDGAGNYIGILTNDKYDFDDGTSTQVLLDFFHNQKVVVAEGDAVQIGDVLAKGDTTGYATGPHCHCQPRRVQWVPAKPGLSAYRYSEDKTQVLVDFDKNDANNSFDPAPYYTKEFAEDVKTNALASQAVAAVSVAVAETPQLPVEKQSIWLTNLDNLLIKLWNLLKGRNQ